MFRSFVIAVCAFGLVSTSVPKQQSKSIVPDQHTQASHNTGTVHGFSGYEANSYGGDFGGHLGSDDGSHSNGAELSGLAHSSAVRAQNAVQGQQTAGSQAAFSAANSLASTALAAAQTAQAAVAGKQAILQNLRRQLTEAERRLQGEITQYQQSEVAALAAHEAAQQSQNQIASLAGIFSTAQGGAQRAEQASAETAKVASSQQSMVLEAKQRVAQIFSQLQHALGDLHETEVLAQKAAESAQIAQSNAAAAGASIAGAGIKGINSNNHHY